MNAAGVVGDDGALTTGTKPFNVFARLVSGAMAQPEMAAANALLDGPAAARFLLACNRKEADEHWASDAEEWVGKASMAERHRFLLLKDLHWGGSTASPSASAAAPPSPTPSRPWRR